MNYYSTRDHQQIVSAAQAIACGLAPDGGLFVPESLPEVSAQQLQALCGNHDAQPVVISGSLY